MNQKIKLVLIAVERQLLLGFFNLFILSTVFSFLYFTFWQILVLLISLIWLIIKRITLKEYYDKKRFFTIHENQIYFFYYNHPIHQERIEKEFFKCLDNRIICAEFQPKTNNFNDLTPALKREFKSNNQGGYPRLLYFEKGQIKIIHLKYKFAKILRHYRSFDEIIKEINNFSALFYQNIQKQA